VIVGRTWMGRLPRVIETPRHQGYTLGMKTAVSIPDEVFERAERLARRVRQTRSEVFSRALREYVARHAPDEVTETMDRVCAEVGDQRDEFVTVAARQTLGRSEW
jgi:metal-responsive CopG/Arc/MetJ family transcriptional regulator